MKKILCIVLCIITAFSLTATAFASGEADCHASWKLSTTSPISAGKTVDVGIYLKTDYVSNVFGAVITYDKTFFEPAFSVESDNFAIAPSIAALGNKTVVMSEKRSQNVAEQMYDSSYDQQMKNKYALAWFSFSFLASKFSNPSSDLFPRFNDFTLVASLKLKVKSTAKNGLVGNVWLDEVYQQKDTGTSTKKYTFVAHANSEIVGKCNSTVKYGQTVDYSQGVLYKSVNVDDMEIRYRSSANISPQVQTYGYAEYSCSYTSSNESVAVVDSDGNIKTNGAGNSVITCTVTDSNGNTASDSCSITVSYAWWQWVIIIFLFGWIWY